MKVVEFEIFKQLMLEINEKDSKIVIRDAIDKGTFRFYRIINSDLVGMK